MLTSFFGKSIPLNYLILSVFIVAGYVFETIFNVSERESAVSLLVHFSFILLSVLAMLLLDFIIRKNHLTRTNTYAILFFTCFMVMLPVVFLHHKLLLANTFLILALRRIMSLRSDTNSAKKILDAGFWIGLASLFYFWSLLFFLPLWIAIIQKPNATYKQMMMPVVGLAAIFIINTAFHLLWFNSFNWFFQWKKPIGLDFSAYNKPAILVPATVIFAFYIWTGFLRILRLASVSLKEKSNYLLMLYVSIVSLCIALLGPEKTGAEILFIFAPTAIIAANYMEGFEADRFVEKDPYERWFKELMLWAVVLLPFLFVLL
jgi:hypothetical protein